MCGICGYIGKKQKIGFLLDTLQRLEYRGYDSCGLAIGSGKRIIVKRVRGKINRLSAAISRDIYFNLGIAHTRWATHGVPSDINAHPHADCKGEIFVVHNGIIENFVQLKNELLKEGHKFKSETDTEIIVHLIEKHYKDDLVSAVRNALKEVIGAYGIAVISAKEPDVLVAAKLGSPLVVGVAKDEFVAASDITAILPITQQVIYMEDGEMAVFKDGNVHITDLENHIKEKRAEKVEWSMEAAEKEGFDHFMQKEIWQQPISIKNSVRGRIIEDEGLVKLGGLESIEKKLRTIDRLVIVGMGTARNAGLIDRKSTRLNSSHIPLSRMPSSA